MLGDVEDILLVLHVNSDELVADLWGMLRVVHRAEKLPLDVLLQLNIAFQLDAFALDLLAPAVLVQTLPEEDDVGQHSAVVALVDSVAHPVQVEGEDLIHEHILAVTISEAVVVPLPFFWICRGRQLLHRVSVQALVLVHGVAISSSAANSSGVLLGARLVLSGGSILRIATLIFGLLTAFFLGILVLFDGVGSFFAGATVSLLLLRHGHWWSIGTLHELARGGIDQVGELYEVLEDWVVVHAGSVLENYSVHLLEAAEGVDWPAISLWGLEEVLCTRVLPLIRVLSWTASSSARSWRVPQLSVGTLGMLLLHVSVKCGI